MSAGAVRLHEAGRPAPARFARRVAARSRRAAAGPAASWLGLGHKFRLLVWGSLDEDQFLPRGGSGRGKRLHALKVRQANPVRHDKKCPLLGELRERPTDGLDRQADVVGDVLPAHRQRHGRGGAPAVKPRPALAQAEEEGDHPLLCRAAPEQHHLVLGLRELVRGEFMQPAQQVRLVVEEGRVSGPRKAAGHDRLDRVRREAVGIVEGQAEEVPGKREADDLTSPIRQELVDAHDAGGDVIDSRGRFPWRNRVCRAA